MLEAFLHAVSAVFVLACMAGLGFYSSSQGWYDEKGKNLVSKLVGLSIPFYLFHSVTTKFTHSELVELFSFSWVPFLAFVIYYAASHLVCRVGLVRSEWHGTFIAQCSSGSILFVGIPVTVSLFGDKGVPYLLVYFLANVLYVWTLGLYNIQLDGVRKKGGPAPSLFSLKSLKMIFTKPLIGFLLGIGCVMLGVTVVKPVAMAVGMMGQIASPLALVFIGITLQQIGFAKLRHLPRETWMLLFALNVFKPLVIFTITAFVPMETVLRQVLIIASVMPVSPMTGVFAKLYDGPVEFAAENVGASVAALAFTLPVIMMLVNFL